MKVIGTIPCNIEIEGVYTPFILIPNDRFEVKYIKENNMYIDFEGYNVIAQVEDVKGKYKIEV